MLLLFFSLITFILNIFLKKYTSIIYPQFCFQTHLKHVNNFSKIIFYPQPLSTTFSQTHALWTTCECITYFYVDKIV